VVDLLLLLHLMGDRLLRLLEVTEFRNAVTIAAVEYAERSLSDAVAMCLCWRRAV